MQNSRPIKALHSSHKLDQTILVSVCQAETL